MYFVCPEVILSWRNIAAAADLFTTRKVVTRAIGLKVSRHFVIQRARQRALPSFPHTVVRHTKNRDKKKWKGEICAAIFSLLF